MAISKINVNGTEHELETTIANVDGLQDALNAKIATTEIASDDEITEMLAEYFS